MNRLTIFLILSGISFFSFGQEKWDLHKCVDYALKNNITVRQADLQQKFASLDLKQSRWNTLPSANFSGSTGFSAGRNQDPTNFSLITTGYLFSNYSLQANVDLFNWFSKQHNIAVRDLNLKATQAGFEKAKNDVALNVALAYLQILLTKEQVNLAKIQLNTTGAQLESVTKQVRAGNLPELNQVQLEAQFATDSSNLVTAHSSVNQYLLQMQILLNLDPAVPFDVESPPVDQIPVESIAELQPEYVYGLARINMPQQQVDVFNLQAAQRSVKAAKAQMYPTFSMFGSLGTAFNSKAEQIISVTPINPPIGTVTVNTATYNVFPVQPIQQANYGKMAYFEQVNQNFRQSIGIGVSIPILSGGSLRSGWLRSRLTLNQVELTKEQNSQTLKQDIYKAFNDATAALEKFSANRKAVDASQKAYDFAKKRFDLGLLSTYDLLNTQNTLLQSKTNLLYAQYDYVFKIKLLEFYKGQGLTL
ncbi:MAG: TolC family protein [Bacteroidetes bacterium]|nr:MAG: TolC family protein [Bacteroidota bacterium]